MRPRLPEQLWSLSRRLHQRGWGRVARAVKTVNWMVHKCLLPAEAVVGKGIILEHYALGVVIHPQTQFGDDCRIYHHVTLAAESGIGSEHKIVVGHRVTIGAHAVVIARSNRSLFIGDDAVIGAGSILTKDVPAGDVWAGNPARFLRKRNDKPL